ncbi:hypothetical protein EMCG_08748 [[Emmonsia] crescens]|uniref:Fungal calcium binding protein domain-containing protein n=1 Tax=[Emmonsia] crescens TaxID=73230 RepID=A0A0G2J401_9EURO|nr:hypothetical protein EMCG_08748 [Emmonsia crescens UAMH 3008]
MYFSKVIATAFALLGAASAAPTEAKRATQVASAFADYKNAVNSIQALTASNGCNWVECIQSLSISSGSCIAALAELGLEWPLCGHAQIQALYGYRYLEIVGGSNLGELLGTAFVGLVGYAWIVAATFLPISSSGWAPGDVSLVAYIQATLARVESKTTNVSALGAVMTFLYTSYIVMYAITSPALGGAENGGDIRPVIMNIGPFKLTILSIVIFTATFVPHGAFECNQ